MSELSAKLHYILQFYFDKGANVAQTHKEICAIYGQDTLSKATIKRWFSRFRFGNFDVQNASRSGQSITEKVDDILIKVE